MFSLERNSCEWSPGSRRGSCAGCGPRRGSALRRAPRRCRLTAFFCLSFIFRKSCKKEADEQCGDARVGDERLLDVGEAEGRGPLPEIARIGAQHANLARV